MTITLRRRLVGAAAAVAVIGTLAACSSNDAENASASGDPSAASQEIKTVRLGFFPNLTHAPALVGMQEGYFKDALKPLGLTVTPTAFNAGPDAVTALFGDSLDITYIGPNPTISAYTQSKGEAVKVVSGAASSGAALVVSPDINTAADLKGKTLATPQLGNTQDVALRYWLKEQGLTTTVEGGGDVSIKPQANADGLTAFGAGQIQGAWVPEPWVSEYVAKGAKVLVNEKDLWPDGKFVTTNILVRSEFLADHPDVVQAVLDAHVQALQEIKKNPDQAKADVNAALQSLTGGQLDPKIMDAAWKQVDFTADPLPQTLVTSAAHAADVGLLDQAEIDAAGGLPGTLYDLSLINKSLADAGLAEVGQ
ncbi:MAG: ABC transporter substrate-binding protein [Candidatus Nanopelagicales bacterium]